MAEAELIEQLRRGLPRLLREHPEVRHELWGLMLEAFPSRQEFTAFLEELRALREESNRRFEALQRELDRRFEALQREMHQGFEAVDQRFKGVIAELREQRLHLSALGGRVGRGLEFIVKGIVEEFAGESFPLADRLALVDADGEVFGVPGVEIEFDLYAHNGRAYLVEVESHLKMDDVLKFQRKAVFAETKLGRPLTRLIIALSMDSKAEALMQRLGIEYQVRATLE
ncbi:MAG: hypothetical protein ACRERE_32510 [Candidatus Entotheonellia bacterium]